MLSGGVKCVYTDICICECCTDWKILEPVELKKNEWSRNQKLRVKVRRAVENRATLGQAEGSCRCTYEYFKLRHLLQSRDLLFSTRLLLY